jgi:hypothetical protein
VVLPVTKTQDDAQKEMDEKSVTMQLDNITGAGKQKEKGKEDVHEGVKRVKVQCSQCGRRGHVTSNCPVPLFCKICERKTHVSHRCTILKGPKPVALSVGYGAPGLGFHYMPVSDKEYNDTKESAAWGSVTVRGGEITKDEVKGELERLVPIQWQWDIKDHGINEFLTVFPNTME